jgi:Protein of unknown function (DUF3987)
MSVEALKNTIADIPPYQLEWPEPLLFDDIETPPISPHLLPPVLRDFVIALANETETPVEMAIACALGTISTTLTGKVVVCPKPGWTESVNTYWLIELPPANRKSKVFKECTRPLIAWETSQREAFEPVITKATSKRKSQEKLIEKRRMEAVKVQDNEQREALFDEIAKLEASLEMIPPFPRLFCNNVTPEALENYTYEQNGRFAVLSDEGGVVQTLTGLYTSGRANIDLLLKGIDGGEFRVARKDRKIDMNPYLTLVLCIQPKIREKMGSNPVLQGNGALERFLYIVPRSTIGYRTHDTAPMPHDIRERYSSKITELLSIKMIDSDGVETPHVLTLSSKAYADVERFEKWLEPYLKPSGELFMCQGWAGKLTGYAARIAGKMHAVEYGVQNTEISAATMRNALLIAYSLITHAKVAYRLMGLDENIANAKRVYDWLICKGCREIRRGELTHALRHHKISSPLLTKAMNELIARHIVRAREEPGKGTKDATIYTVNPKIMQPPPVTTESSESCPLTEVTELTSKESAA